MWNELSIKKKSNIIGLAVKNGITNLNTIKEVYNNYVNKYPDGGKVKTYVRENGNHIAFDKEGNLVDQITGEKGTMIIPEVVVSARDPKNYRSSFDRYAVPDLINWVTENTVGRALSPIIENVPYAANVAQALTPSSWVGTLKTGKAPWDLTNTGFGETKDDEVKNMLFDALAGYKGARGVNRANKIRKGLTPKYLRHNLFYNRAPVGYDKIRIEGNLAKAYPQLAGKEYGKSLGQTVKDVLKTIYSGELENIDAAPWLNPKNFEWAESMLGVPAERAMKAREDSYRMYIGEKPKNNIFITHPENPNYLTDIGGIKGLEEFPSKVVRELEVGKPSISDFINTTGGNMGHTNTKLGSNSMADFGIITTRDAWDINPFGVLLRKLDPKSKSKTIQNMAKRLDKVELGKVLPGLKVHNYRYDIPYTRVIDSQGTPHYYRGFLGDDLPTEAGFYMKQHPHLEYATGGNK